MGRCAGGSKGEIDCAGVELRVALLAECWLATSSGRRFLYITPEGGRSGVDLDVDKEKRRFVD